MGVAVGDILGDAVHLGTAVGVQQAVGFLVGKFAGRLVRPEVRQGCVDLGWGG